MAIKSIDVEELAVALNGVIKAENTEEFMLDMAKKLRERADYPTRMQSMQGFLLPDGSIMNWHDYNIYIAEEIERKYGGIYEKEHYDRQTVCGDVKEQHDWANKWDFNLC